MSTLCLKRAKRTLTPNDQKMQALCNICTKERRNDRGSTEQLIHGLWSSPITWPDIDFDTVMTQKREISQQTGFLAL